MEGQIVRIINSGRFTTYIIRLEKVGIGRTYTGKTYRNWSHWKELKVGDLVGGLRWKEQKRGILDADSPVYVPVLA